ncbi:MAG: hypothetical protein GY930_12320 [bacterium]|nr:hypothetical protein [bacterium]
MTFSSAPVRLLISSLVFLCLGSSLIAQSLPENPSLPPALTELDLEHLAERFLDRVVVIAGDQVITHTDVYRHLQSKKWKERSREAEKAPKDRIQQERNRVIYDATADLVEAFLEVRAGQDRGFDPELVEVLVERRFNESQKRYGGYQAFYRELKLGNSSPEVYRESIRRSLYRHAWQGAITGRQLGVTGRKELNGYVRPGQLWGAYRSFLKSPRLAEVELTGFREAQFETLEIAISFESQGGRENTLRRIEETYAKLLDGTADFVEFFDYLSKNDAQMRTQSTHSWALGKAANVSQTEFGGTTFLDFLTQGKVGDISPPLESKEAVHLFLLTKIEPEVPSKPFANLEVQAAIRKHLTEKQRKIRLGRARMRLIQESQLQPQDLAKHMIHLAQVSMDG